MAFKINVWSYFWSMFVTCLVFLIAIYPVCNQVWDQLCVQLTSYLEGGPLMWMMPLHLHANQKSHYDIMMMFRLNFFVYQDLCNQFKYISYLITWLIRPEINNVSLSKELLGVWVCSGGFRGGSGGSLEPPYEIKLFSWRIFRKNQEKLMNNQVKLTNRTPYQEILNQSLSM